jgi:hypothetical protein
LTSFAVALDRVHKWGTSIGGQIRRIDHVACDALAGKRSVEVAPGGLSGFDGHDFDLNCKSSDFLEFCGKGFTDLRQQYEFDHSQFRLSEILETHN